MNATRPVVHLGPAFWVWLALVLIGVVVVATTGLVLLGGLIMGTGFVFAALSRVVLTGDAAAGVHIRRRHTDIAMHLLFAAAVIAAALLVHLREGG